MTKENIILTSTSMISVICIILILVFYKRMKQSIMGAMTNNYFTDKELYKSSTANKNHIDNTPNQAAMTNLHALRDKILNPARQLYGSCIFINCGYRCPKLNALVGGASNSQHLTGQAADITTGTIEGNRKLFEILVKLGNYDQLIWEGQGSWIHVSYSTTARHTILAQTTTGGYINIKSNWQKQIA